MEHNHAKPAPPNRQRAVSNGRRYRPPAPKNTDEMAQKYPANNPKKTVSARRLFIHKITMPNPANNAVSKVCAPHNPNKM